jgi:hypothetical protein
MTAKNLAIVFGPNLARHRPNTKVDPQKQLKDSNTVNQFFEFVIENYSRIYDFDMKRWKTIKGRPNPNFGSESPFSGRKVKDFFVKYFVPATPTQYPM